MINVSVQIEVTTSGDGQTFDDQFLEGNPNGVLPTKQNVLATNVTVTVPTNARGVIVVWPATSATRSIKGLSADAGITLPPGGSPNWAKIPFPKGSPPASFVVSSTARETWTFVWL